MSKIRVASLAEIDAKGARTFRIEDTEIAVFRLSDGSVRPSRTAVLIRAGSCRKAWYAERRCTARCMTGRSIWRAAGSMNLTMAA